MSLPLSCAACTEATSPCEQPDRLRLLLQGLQLHLGASRVSAMKAPSLAAGGRLQCNTASGKPSLLLVYEVCALELPVAASAKAPSSSPQAVLLSSVVLCGSCEVSWVLCRLVHLIC